MSDIQTGADRIVCYLTGAFAGDQPQDQVSLSIGKYRSSVRSSFLSWIARRSIFGLRVDWISPSCNVGEATIHAVGPNALTFAAPFGKAGPATTILNGETKIVVDQNDSERFVVVTRTSAADLVGHTDMNIRAEFNNVVSGATIRQGDLTNAVMFVNHGPLAMEGFTLWLPPLTTDLAQPSHPLPGAGWDQTLVPGGVLQIGDASTWYPDTRMIQIREADDVTLKGYVAGVLEGPLEMATFHITAIDVYAHGGLGTGQNGERVLPVSPLRIASERPQTDADGVFIQSVLSNISPPPTSGGISAWNYGISKPEGFQPLNSAGIAGQLLPNESMGIWLHKSLPTDDPILDSTHLRQAWSPALIDDLSWGWTDGSVTYEHHARGFRRREGRYSDTRYFMDASLDGVTFTPLDVDRYLGHMHSPTQLPIRLPFYIRPPGAGDWRHRTFKINIHGMQTLIGEHSLSIDDQGAIVLGPPSEPVNINVVQSGKDLIVTASYYAGADGDRRADNWTVSATFVGKTAGPFFFPMSGIEVENLAATLNHPDWQSGQAGFVNVLVTRSSDGVAAIAPPVPFTLAAEYSLTLPEADQHLSDRRIVT